MKDKTDILEKRLARERKARETAEKLLEQKALELYQANQKLQELNASLQEEVASKTSELERQSSRLTIILKSLQEGVLVEDENRRILLANQTFCDIFELPIPPEALIGADCAAAMEESKFFFEKPDYFVEQVNKMLNLKDQSEEIILHTKSGRILTLSYTLIKNKDLPIGHLWRYQDKTEEIQADIKIRQSEEKYRSIMENMSLGLMEVDVNGRITKVYDYFLKMMGYQNEKELIGQKADSVFLPPEFKEVMDRQDELRREGEASSYEIQMLTKSGERKWVLIGGAPFFATNGELEGTIGIHYDITHQKVLQKELEIARQDAEAARDAEKEFLANMSHEIRNPINSIIGMTNLMYDTHPSKDQLEYLNYIKYSSELLLALVSDILDLSKISEGKMDINPQAFSTRDFIHTIAKTIEYRLQNSPVSFSLELDPNLPQGLIGDATFLSQILFNLLSNAIKFTQQGKITLSVKLLSQQDKEVYLKFIVRDTGIGIPLEKQAHIFERFGQAGKADAASGTGLGLPITRELIELMGGHISLESTPGEGACFQFSLPFVIKTGEAQPVMDLSQNGDSLQELGLKILVVEDNEANRVYLEKLLDKWQIRHRSAANGQEALDISQQDRFDLILMDIRMPVMDGYEAAVRLRASSHNPNQETPIIALTASALLDEKEKAIAAGMNLHLTKPFTPEKLSAAIQRFFENTQEETKSVEGFQWPKPFSQQTLDDLYAGDLDYAGMMFGVFLKNIEAELQTMEEHLKTNAREKAADLLHKIKPNFTMLGLPELGNQLSELEVNLRDQDAAHPQEAWTKLREEIQSLLPLIKAVYEQLNQAS